MSETCHPGIAYILQLYTEEQSRVDTALTHTRVSYVQGRRDERNGVALSAAFGLDGDLRAVSLLYPGIIRAGTWQETP